MGRVRRCVRLLSVVVLVGLLAWRVGPAAVAQSFRHVDGASFRVALPAAVAAAGISTVCVAWRWVLVARGFGLELTLPHAVAASYRAQFLNVTLPMGVAGDVHRAVAHGRAANDPRRGAYAVLCERTLGQVVQVALALAALWVAAPHPGLSGPVISALAVCGLAVVVMGARLRRSRFRANARTAGAHAKLGRALPSGRAWPAPVALSVVAVAAHVGTFVLVARAAGVAEVPVRLVPVALVVLLAAAVPVSLAGWGPREGAAAWVFGAAGLGADHGVVVAALYGAVVIVASLPGAVVILASSVRLRRSVRAETGATAPGGAHV